MNELLKLCGYEEAEIETELPRVEKAFSKLGLKAKDIEMGKQRLHKYYDMELKGVRKIFRLFLLEFVDSILVREEGKTRLIYGFMAPRYEMISCVINSVSKEAYSINQCWAFLVVMGCILNKIIPVFEAAEDKWLKAGLVTHCGNVKILTGTLALGLLPKPDLLITTGALCETAPKTLDLLHEYYDIPVCFYETCQDRESEEYSLASKRAIELEVKSLRKLVDKIHQMAGVEITDDRLGAAFEARQKLDIAIGKMRNLLITSDPLPLSPTHENLWSCLNSLTLYCDRLQDAIEAVNILYIELQERVNRGIGVIAKGSPRVLAICPGHQTDPAFEHLVNELGIAMAATDSIFSLPYDVQPQGPFTKLALPLQSIRLISPAKKIPLIIEGCKKLKVDGVINRYHAGCRTVVGDAILINNALVKEAGIPTLMLDWENFDPRVFNYEQYKNKLEMFKTVMLNKRDSSRH
jgi:benzoyl-CoA reductase/2-hydroxyglutaryl-CoA dehydratase subunit BcrC/BadD/HgdB